VERKEGKRGNSASVRATKFYWAKGGQPNRQSMPIGGGTSPAGHRLGENTFQRISKTKSSCRPKGGKEGRQSRRDDPSTGQLHARSDRNLFEWEPLVEKKRTKSLIDCNGGNGRHGELTTLTIWLGGGGPPARGSLDPRPAKSGKDRWITLDIQAGRTIKRKRGIALGEKKNDRNEGVGRAGSSMGNRIRSLHSKGLPLNGLQGEKAARAGWWDTSYNQLIAYSTVMTGRYGRRTWRARV